MVGFGSSFRLRSIALIVFALAKFSASPPAEKATPRPVRTTIRVLPSAPSDLKASVSEWMTLSSIALRTCGRLIATVATPRASLVMRTQASLISGRLRHRRLSTREMSDCTISCSAQTRSEVASKLGFVRNPRRGVSLTGYASCACCFPWLHGLLPAFKLHQNRTEFHSRRRVHGHCEQQPLVARWEQRHRPVREPPSPSETPRTRKART